MSRHSCSPSRSAASSSRAASAMVDATAPDVPAMSSTTIRTSSAWSDAIRSVVAARSSAAPGSVGPPAPAWSTSRSTPSASHAAHGRAGQRSGLGDELLVRRRDVHQVRRVRDERSQTRCRPVLAERGGLLVGHAWSGPAAGIRDEDLRGVGSPETAFLDGAGDPAGATADVRPDPHTMKSWIVSPYSTVHADAGALAEHDVPRVPGIVENVTCRPYSVREVFGGRSRERAEVGRREELRSQRHHEGHRLAGLEPFAFGGRLADDVSALDVGRRTSSSSRPRRSPAPRATASHPPADAPTTFGTGTGSGPLLTATSTALPRGAFPVDHVGRDPQDEVDGLVAVLPFHRSQREVRALQDGSGFLDRLALEVGHLHRLRPERRHERDGLALLERRSRGRSHLGDGVGRDIELIDPVRDLHVESLIDQARTSPRRRASR